MDSSLAEMLWLDATAQAELIATGQASAAELVDAAIARCEEVNPTLNAIFMRASIGRDRRMHRSTTTHRSLVSRW